MRARTAAVRRAANAASRVITLVVALPSEARPLIEHYGLVATTAHAPYRIMANERLRLVVSGVGKTACAAATGYCAGRFADSLGGAWLNVGIAGHRDHPVGAPLLADTIRDAASARCWQPPVAFSPPCARGTVTTFDTPNLAYPADTACDMEAAGFMASAGRFSPHALTHVVKVVSDTPGSGIEAITRTRVEELMRLALPAIDAVTHALEGLLHDIGAERRSAKIETLLARVPFSTAQAWQLATLVRLWVASQPAAAWPSAALDGCDSATEILATVQTMVTAAGPARHPGDTA